MALQRRVPDISKDVGTHLSDIFNKCVYCSLNADESMDITSTAQICIFARDVRSDFEVFEEHGDLHSMQGHTKGCDFIHALLYSLQKHNPELCNLVGSY